MQLFKVNLGFVGGCLLFCSHLYAQEAAPPDCSSKKPNVLFIMVDDLNDWIGVLKGHQQVKTPNIDRLAAKGMLFSNAHCSMPVCVASRNSMLTGLHPTTTGWYSGVPDIPKMQQQYRAVMKNKPALPEYFKNNGYKTLTVGKVFHDGASDYPELTDRFWDTRGPTYDEHIKGKFLERGGGYLGLPYYPFPRNGSKLKAFYGDKLGGAHSLCGGPLTKEDIPEVGMFDEIIANQAVEWLGQPQEKPFFMAVGFIRPHVPFTAPKRFFDLYDESKIQIPNAPANEMNDIPMYGKAIAYGMTNFGDHKAVTGVSEDHWRHLVYSYLACVSFVDHQLGLVLDALEKSPHSKNTIVVFCSDHGHSLGEKKHWRKMCLWEESTKIPLIIKYPEGEKIDGECKKPVSLLDIYPTLVDLCGLKELTHLEGRNIAPLLKNPAQEWDFPALISWKYGNLALRGERYKYIRYRDGSEELYDHQNDPNEFTNIANLAEHKVLISKFRSLLPEDGGALPFGEKQFTEDILDQRVKLWKSSGTPEWLK